MNITCIFCKIVVGEIPSAKVYESDSILAIKNINPQAPIHYLVLPKKHIEGMGVIEPEDFELVADMAHAVKTLSEDLEGHRAFNIISNNGKEAGQSVFHMHWHFIAGRNLYADGALKL